MRSIVHPTSLTALALLASTAIPCFGAEVSTNATRIEVVGPKAVTPTMVYYFGVMQPNQIATHRFEVRNEGDSPLELSNERGSCKCLSVTVEPSTIPSGGKGEVIVRWRAGEETGEPFRQLIRVQTNDPDLKTLELVVSGDVGGHIGLGPSRVAWKNARRGVALTEKVRVGSTYWQNLYISEVVPSNPRLKVAVRNIPAERRLKGAITASQELEITAPADLTTSNFTALIDFMVSPRPSAGEPGPSQEESAEQAGRDDPPIAVQLPVSFELGAPLSIVGAGYLDREKRAYLGVQSPGEKITRGYMVKVRDEEKRLVVRDTRVSPDYVRVSFEEYSLAKGLYRLQLELPPDSLERAYIGSTAGGLELEFDHPRIKSLRMKLEMSPSH